MQVADEIVWEDPGPSASGLGQWVERLQPLVEAPGRWARVKEFKSQGAASSTMSQLKRRQRQMPPGEWEFVTRGLPDGRGALYARYIGPRKGNSSG